MRFCPCGKLGVDLEDDYCRTVGLPLEHYDQYADMGQLAYPNWFEIPVTHQKNTRNGWS